MPEILLVGPYEADVKGIRETLQALKLLREDGATFALRRISTIALSHDEASLGVAAVDSCVVNAVKRWEFPQPDHGGLAVVSYPFSFSPAGG